MLSAFATIPSRLQVALCFLFSILWCAEAGAQLPSFTHFDRLTIDNGLSSNSHNTIFKDSKGLIWITSQDGLNRYDGLRIKKYYHDEKDSFSLPNNWTITAEEDAEGRLWISTIQGICLYNRKKDRFEGFSFRYAPATILFAEKFRGLWDHQWLFNINGNLLFKDIASGKEKVYSVIPASVSRKDFSVFRYGRYILLGLINGLYFFDTEKGKLLDSIPMGNGILHHTFNETVTSFYEDASCIWISTWGGGLVQVDKRTAAIKRHRIDIKFPFGYGGSNICYNILERKDDKGQRYFLMGTNMGLTAFYPALESFRILYASNIEENNGWPMHIYEDDEGILWMEQSAAGVAIYKPEKNFFGEVLIPNRYHVRDHYLNQVIADPQDTTGNTLWIGSFGTGVIKFNLRSGLLDHYFKKDQQDFNFLENIFLQRNGVVWLINKACMQFDEPRRAAFFPRDKNSGRDIRASSIAEDDEGNLWFACRDTLVKKNANGDFFYYGLPEVYLKNGQHISQVIWDAGRNYIWFSSFNGIGYFDTRSSRFADASLLQKWSAVKNSLVSSMDNQGRVLISSQRGLWILSGKDFQPLHFTTSEGLPSNICYHVVQDNNFNYWLSTGNGLCKISADLSTIQNFGKEDGVIASHLDTKIFKLKDGRLALPYNNYLQIWDPAHFDRLKKAPSFFITDILVNGKNYSDYHTEKNSVTFRLAHDQNTIQLNTGLNQYMFAGNSQIKYRINGGGWQPVINQQLSLILQPATYRIEMAGRSTNTAWSEEPYTIYISIAPPFWKTWWFNLAVISLATGIVYSLYRYRIRQILKLQYVRNTIAQDLHDDVGSTMTTISILSEVARQKLSSVNESDRILDEIGTNSRELLGKLDDIVWSVNPGNDSLQHMSLRMKQLAIDLLGNKGVKVEFVVPENIDAVPLSMQNRRNVYLVYKEALHNISKYAQATNVTVQISFSQKQLVLVIKDNGSGFDREAVAAPEQDGLNNMQQRARQAGGSCTITSLPGAGTTVRLAIPIG
jgi:ligand-binding sensor domain-containing protein